MLRVSVFHGTLHYPKVTPNYQLDLSRLSY